MSDYWLGVLTLPAVTLMAYALFVLWLRVVMALEARGITFEAKIRDTSKISGYTLRHDIWWERSFGPVFVGGWYRERGKPVFTRWIGLGPQCGPCLMGFWKRDA